MFLLLYIVYYTYTIISYTYIYYYILSYTILFSSSDLFSYPFLLSLLPNLLSLPPSLPSSPNIPSIISPPFPPNHSIRVGVYISLFIFSSDLSHPNLPILLNNSTPHKLTEWMVEVCRFEYLGILFYVSFWFDVRCILYITIIYIIYYIILLYIYYYILSYTILFLSFRSIFGSIPLFFPSLFPLLFHHSHLPLPISSVQYTSSNNS